MIRVYFEEREPADLPANQCAVGAAGELILNMVELGEGYDKESIRKVTTVTGVTWVRTYSAASGWLYAEPVAEESAVAAEAGPPVLTESTVGSEAEPEEAIR